MAKRGRKPGYVSSQRKFGTKTKVARIPAHWNIDEIWAAMERTQSCVEDAEQDLADAKTRSACGKISNRFEKLAAHVAELRDILEGSTFAEPEEN